MSRTAPANRPVRPSQSARVPAAAARAGLSPRASTTATADPQVKSNIPTAASLIAIMSELQVLLSSENDALRRGLPAAAVEATEAKERLQTLFRSQYRYILRRGAAPLGQKDAEHLQELGMSLRTLAIENATRLDAALKASQQRIEQVMTALRQRVASDHASYGKDYANIHTLRAHFTDYGRSLEV